MRVLMVSDFSIFVASPLNRWASLIRWVVFMDSTHPNTASGAEFARLSGVRPVWNVLCGVLFIGKPELSRNSVTEYVPKAQERKTYEVHKNNLLWAFLFQRSQVLGCKSGDCPFH